MKNILVCGGCGFIGSNLINELVKNENNYIICVDNLLSGNIKNINHLINNNRFKFINHDIIYPLDFINDYKIDEIYNFACVASPIKYQEDMEHTVKTSVLGIINLLDIANKHNCKILQASTSEVYGDSLVSPQSEDYFGNVNINGIRSCYDEGKRCAETIMYSYYKKYNTKIKIIRIFNTYGVNMDKNDGRVISNFINQALNNEDITIYGNGNQTRSFQYIDDLIDGVIKVMNTSDDINYPLNIGNDEEYKIIDLANIIIDLTKSKSKIVFKDLPMDDPKKRKPNINKIKSIIDWYPKISLNEGLNKTIEYYKKNKSGIN